MADVQKVLEQKLLDAAKVVEEQIDAEIEKLEKLDEDGLEMLRKKRLDALRHQEGLKQKWLTNGHGEYTELSDEKEFFDSCKKSENFVCHFYRESTFRCKILDKHLAILAKKHIETKFCKIDAEKALFLAQRLKVKVLPTIALCKDSKTRDYIIGFDDLGGTDDFATDLLEKRIARAGVINYSGAIESQAKQPGIKIHQKNIRRGANENDSDSDEN